MDASIIIVNYNTYKLTTDCIRSVYEHTSGIEFEIILVDNASSEIEAIAFEKLFPQIRVIRLTENKGFAGGNNAALPYATGRYILLLNSDTILIENSIKITCKYLDNHPKAGVVSARLIFPDGRHQSVAQRFPSIKYKLTELLRLQKLIDKKQAGAFLLGSFFDHKVNVKADWVWGAFFMFRAEILKALPGNVLDDSYFMYSEDMQWCWDIHKLGYEVHFCADTTLIHLMGGSSGKKNELMIKSGNLFFKKNYNFLERFFIRSLDRILS